MNRLDRRKLVLGTTLLAGAGLAGLLRPRPTRRPGAQPLIEAALPLQLGNWHQVALADFILPPGDALGTGAYDALVLRGFARGSDQVIYCVITYGAVQDYALQLHRPEVCYPASGFAIRQLGPFLPPIAGTDLGASLMVASRDDRTETVLYWTRVGQAFPRSQWEVRKAILAGLSRYRLPDGAMVRLSMLGAPGNATNALLAEVARDLVRGLAGPGRALLLGEGR